MNESYIIAVAGGKGGVGKSVFTANLAFAAQKELRTPVLLIDLDQKSCGDQNIITGLKPVKTVSQFIDYKGVLSQTSLKGLLAHHPSGLSYLGAVTSPEQKLSGDSQLFSQQMKNLAAHYKYVFVDIGCEIGDLQRAILNHISVLLIVVTPEILVVNQTRRILNDIAGTALPHQFMRVIVNKHQNSGVQTSTIQQALKVPILSMVPNDEVSALQSLQSSQPFVLSRPNYSYV